MTNLNSDKFPNDKQLESHKMNIREKIMGKVKPVISLLIKEKFKPSEITESEATELHRIHSLNENTGSINRHGYKSFIEFVNESRGE